MQNLQQTIHNISLEIGPHLAAKAHQHVPHVRAPQELLPVLHVGPEFRADHTRA
jgi:hypothetical protein